MKSKLLGLAAVAALAIGFATSGASAFPADKASISSSALVFKHLADADGTDPSAANVTLLGPIKYKTSTPGDVIATFHTECLLLTKSRTLAKSGDSGARLEVGIQISPDLDGMPDPAKWQSVQVSENDDGSNATVSEFGTFIGTDPGVGRVTMCGRWQKVSYDFADLADDPADFIEVWTETRQTHGFQWAIINPAQEDGFSNTFWIRVRGTVDATASAGSESGVAVAKRLLSLTPVKLHQVITDTNSGCSGDCP